jgi:hypothetical protein
MKILILTILLALVQSLVPFSSPASLSQSQCWSYQCGSIKSTCLFPSASTYTYTVSPCSELSRPYCSPMNLVTNTTCSQVSQSRLELDGYPGEACNSDSDCVYGKCLSRYCYGKVLYENCKSHLECNPGLRCSNNICTTLLKTGKGCTTDFDCVSTAGCNNKVCTEYYSLAVNSIVSDCLSGDQSSMFCESGSCAYSKSLKSNICIEGFISKNVPSMCKTSNDCVGISKSGYTVNKNCECGMNWNGTKYCAANYGDEVAINFRNQFKKFMKSGLFARCNTQRRFDKDCLDISYNTYAYEDLIKSYYLYTNLPQLSNISNCVKTVFFPALSSGLQLLISCLILVTIL